MLIPFILIQLIATFLLWQAIQGGIIVLQGKFKFDFNAFCLTCVGILFLLCSSYLSFSSLKYWCLFGGITTAYHLLAYPSNRTRTQQLFISIISFIFWAHCICFDFWASHYFDKLYDSQKDFK